MNRNTKEYRQSLRAAYIPKGEQVSKIELKDGSAVVYLFTAAGRPYAKGFRGSAGRPDFYHSFRTEQARRQFVLAFLDGVRAAQGRKAARRQQRAAWTNPLKGGEILYTSWGYDQTNVEFYAVTRVSGRRVWVREICADFEPTGFMSGRTWPLMPIEFKPGAPETMHTAQPSGSESGVYVKISDCQHAHILDGRALHTSSYA
jgi:hypothetical protein